MKWEMDGEGCMVNGDKYAWNSTWPGRYTVCGWVGAVWRQMRIGTAGSGNSAVSF